MLDDTGDAARREASRFSFAILAVEETFFLVGDEEGWIDIAPNTHIVLEGLFGFLGDKDDTEFSSFPTDAEFFFFEVDMVTIETDELGDTEPGRKEELENSSIPEALGIFRILVMGSLDESHDFFVFEEVYLTIFGLADLYFFRWESLDILFGEILEESSQYDGVVRLGIFLEIFPTAIFLAIQVEAVFPYFGGGNLGGFSDGSPGQEGS